jgi:predicted SAM-dependent methyltransferase
MGHKIDLGCGNHKKEGFTGIDFEASVKPDIVHDLTKNIPFPDNSVEEIFSSHFLEHLPFLTMKGLIANLVPVCMEGAKVEFVVPLNFPDPSHLQLLDYDWVAEIINASGKTFTLRSYSIEIVSTTSILPHEYGKPFSYEQARAIFKVMKGKRK